MEKYEKFIQYSLDQYKEPTLEEYEGWNKIPFADLKLIYHELWRRIELSDVELLSLQNGIFKSESFQPGQTFASYEESRALMKRVKSQSKWVWERGMPFCDCKY
jgi:hypothetical protein